MNSTRKQPPSAFAFIRIGLGITQQQLADDLGISRTLIAMAERGSRSLPQKVIDYLQKLMEIAQTNPLHNKVLQNKRASLATIRPTYNRVPFSKRDAKNDDSNIDTLNKWYSVLSDAEIRLTGENLKARFAGSGQNPGSADACRELVNSLEAKQAVTRQRIDLLQLRKNSAPEKAAAAKADLLLISSRLKVYRNAYKNHPLLRNKYRRLIAQLYLKKLNTKTRLEKFNRTAIKKLNEEITALKENLNRQESLKQNFLTRIHVLNGY